VPQAGGISSALGLVAGDGDEVHQFNPATQNYDNVSFWVSDPGIWIPSEPTIAVAEGFWYNRAGTTAGSWDRTFSVN
jgi:hypothetical protein